MRTIIAAELAQQEIRRLLKPPGWLDLSKYEEQVKHILEEVRDHGDDALFAFTEQFDETDLRPLGLRVNPDEVAAALNRVDADLLRALKTAQKNIEVFHRKQLQNSWMEHRADGTVLGQLCNPLDCVGVYVPGGRAVYPSSVLMTVIPAKVAGVSRVVLCSPPQSSGRLCDEVLAAAALTGVDEVYRIGGAQAIAALAFGTESLQPVDKIVGPGNIYVTVAKRLVFGVVGIDMLAGPSEILIIADDSANPACVAADLLSQAEHDPLATCLLITDSISLAREVEQELMAQLETLPKKVIASESLDKNGLVILVENLEQAIQLANQRAPEHLELTVREPWRWVGRLRNAGAIFLGECSTEPMGDYVAGPNHVLPTGGCARFASALGVDDYIKKSSLIALSREGFEGLASEAVILARSEGLEAHARAVEIRREL